jgi:uncharacterized protein (TIGR03437 family)
VAVDGGGNVYVADIGNHMVVRIAKDGTLTVVAGNGKPGFSGDGGPATHASLNTPIGVALDAAGNLFIADEFNQRIRRVGTDGTIATIAGTGGQGFGGDGGPATAAPLLYPYGGVVDKAGSYYFADALNHRIRKVAADGTISTVAGNGTAGFSGDGGSALNAQITTPNAVTMDAAGNLLISDTGNHRVRKVSAGGTISTIAGNGTAGFSGDGGPAAGASLNTPHGVAADAAGNVYITDQVNERVRKVAPDGTITTFAGTGVEDFTGDGGPAKNAALNFPFYVAADTAGNVYIADTNNFRVRKVGADGNIATIAGNGGTFSGDGGSAIGAVLNYPSNVAVDGKGNIYVADTGNDRVRKVARDGTITTIAGNGKLDGGGDGGPGTSASLNHPYGIALDTAGNLFIADTHNNKIRELTADGVIRTVAGKGARGYTGDGGQALAATFANPRGVAVDGAGNIYVADSFNHVIREVTVNGAIKTIAGTGTAGFSGDGGTATSAQLNEPLGVAVDTAGNVYVLDSLNARVRKITPDGKINTIAGNGQTGFTGDGSSAANTAVFYPFALAVGSGGALYIADTYNCRIRRVTPDGAIATVAGTGPCGFSGDGSPAFFAVLNYPGGVAVDAGGNLFIADTGNSRVREVLASGTAIPFQANPASLSFSAVAGGAAAAAQTLSLGSVVSGLAFSVTSSAQWLTVSDLTGSIPAAIDVNANPSGLAAGTYTGTLTVTATDATPKTVPVAVTFTVAPAPAQPSLSVATPSLAFAGAQGGGTLTRQVKIANSGGGTLAFAVTAKTDTGGNWLSVGTTSGTATAANPATPVATADIGSLAPGTYSGTITVTGGGTTATVPVTLSVAAPAAVLLLSQSALTFSAVAQGGAPLPQGFGVLNTGQGAMKWSATASTTSGGNWLQVSPASGTVQQPYLDVSQVSVSVNPAGLAAGNYYGQVSVAAAAGNTPQILTVTLTILPVGSSLGPEVRPSGLIFTGVAGADPGSQDVLVGNPKAQADNFDSGFVGKGFTYLPRNSSVPSGQPTTVRVFPKFSDLSAGDVQHGTITLQFGDGTPVTIRVLSVVAPAGSAGGQAAEATAGTCSSPKLEIQYRTLRPGFVAVVGQGTTVEMQMTDDCGNLVGPGISSGAAAQATFSNGDPSVNLVHVGSGVWTGTWRPLKGGSGPVTVTVTAFLIQGSSTKAGQVDISGTIGPGGNAPTVRAQGVVQGASFAAGVPIAPGSLVAIYGTNLADGVGISNQLPLPQQLSGTQLRMGDKPLPILYASPGQINVQLPFDLPLNSQYQVTVQRGGVLSVPEELVIAAAQPGIFTTAQTGIGQGVIVKSDLVTLAQPGTPASAGDVIVLYCTGLGTVDPPVGAGVAAPTSPLSQTVNPVSVTVGGQSAQVLFAGLSPGSAALYQVNAIVPAGVAPGAQVPVTITVAGQTSPVVTMAVQ